MKPIKKFNENQSEDEDKVIDMYVSSKSGEEDINFYLCIKTQSGKKYYMKVDRRSPFKYHDDFSIN